MLEELKLDRRLQIALDSFAFQEPTEVQRTVIPAALSGVDLQVSAETGSGKTLAYLLPLAQTMLGSDIAREAGTLALVLVPTRELARQVVRECRQLLAKTPLSAQAITGGADFKYQKSLFRKNPEIIVATPGRLLEHCEKGSADLSYLQTLVLDEADRMLDMGFREDVLKIAAFCSPTRQTLMLSATLKHRGLGAIANTLLQSAQKIAVGRVRQPHSSISHQRILADGQAHKDKLLVALLQQGGYRRALVFGNKRVTATRLANLLRLHQLRSAELHGDMSTEERKRVMHQFSDAKFDILCASDVAARGLDIKDIDLVINYDLPHSGDDYLHRTGRTGRAGATGLAVSLVSAGEWNLMISIERYLKLRLEHRNLPGLKARYRGPKKQKTSGKAAGSKKKGNKTAPSRSKSGSAKRRDAGKRKADTGGKAPATIDGFAPLMKKKSDD